MLSDKTLGGGRPLPDGAYLLRHMDLASFVSTLSTSALFFPKLSRLRDYRETMLPLGVLESIPVSQGDPEVALQAIRTVVNKGRGLCCVCCWYSNEHQDVGMWERYSRDGGLAIQTTGPLLHAAITDPRDLHGVMIDYLDHDKPPPHLGGPMSIAYFARMWKSRAYASEREYRLVLWPELSSSSFDPDDDSPGKLVKVDLQQLIAKVWVHPRAEAWQLSIVRSLVEKYGLTVPVERSQAF